jgi:hypothetical protein
MVQNRHRAGVLLYTCLMILVSSCASYRSTKQPRSLEQAQRWAGERMNRRYYRAHLLLLLLGLLSSCASTTEPLLYVSPAGITTQPAGAPAPAGGLVIGKNKGSITVQLGQGNTNSDNTKAGQRSDAAAIGPQASAAAQHQERSATWGLYAALLLSGALGWELLRRKLPSVGQMLASMGAAPLP